MCHLNLPAQVPHTVVCPGMQIQGGNTELGCFQRCFNSSSLSLAARMYFIQQWLLMQPLLIFLSPHIPDTKLPFSCFQPECSCDFSSLHPAFPFPKGDQSKWPLKEEKKSPNQRWCCCFTFYYEEGYKEPVCFFPSSSFHALNLIQRLLFLEILAWEIVL